MDQCTGSRYLLSHHVCQVASRHRDLSEVGVVNWSWGASLSLFAAARSFRINALVEMDGSIRYYPGLVKRAGDFIESE